jgi:hypothetical protein
VPAGRLNAGLRSSGVRARMPPCARLATGMATRAGGVRFCAARGRRPREPAGSGQHRLHRQSSISLWPAGARSGAEVRCRPAARSAALDRVKKVLTTWKLGSCRIALSDYTGRIAPGESPGVDRAEQIVQSGSQPSVDRRASPGPSVVASFTFTDMPMSGSSTQAPRAGLTSRNAQATDAIGSAHSSFAESLTTSTMRNSGSSVSSSAADGLR